MLKYVLLGSAMMITSPVLAQEVTGTPQTTTTADMPQAQPAESGTTTTKSVKKSKRAKGGDSATTTSTEVTTTAPADTAIAADPTAAPAATVAQAAPPAAPAAATPPASTAQTTTETSNTQTTVAQAPATAADPAAAAPTATAATPAAGDQVVSTVDAEFGAYDKDGSGSLSRTEFAAWMNALKAKANAGAKPDAAYNNAAFKQADTNKSKSVDKQELASFLSGSAAAS